MSFGRRNEASGEGRSDSEAPEELREAGDRDDESPPGVAGERGLPPQMSFTSIQSRVSTVLTVGFMTILAAGLLVYYYARALSKGPRAHDVALLQHQRSAQGESTLPPLSPMRMPQIVPAASAEPPVHDTAKSSDSSMGESAFDRILGGPPAPPPDGSAAQIPLAATDANTRGGGATPGVPKSPRQLALDRKLSGPVLVRLADPSQIGGSMPHTYDQGTGPLPFGAPSSSCSGGEPPHEDSHSPTTLESLLHTTVTAAVTAQVLPTQRYLLPQGAFVDCTLETAISSSLPGMTTCITATDTYSADGTVVLLERGSKLTGETRGVVQSGSPRLFVLWTQARTPTGIVVPLASPGTDELGRSGLSGSIDWHWWQRFGSALLISVVDGAIQAATDRSNSTSVQLNPSGASDVIASVLRSSLDIPPTVNKPQGDRIQIFVARDVDFRTVYSLSAQPTGVP